MDWRPIYSRSATMSAANKIKMLAVDDDPAHLRALEAILADFNLDLVTAPSGPEALRHLRTDEFALVLLDTEMPGMSGLELATLVRQGERNNRTPILFQSNSRTIEETIFRSCPTGVVDYLLKPIVPEVLRARVSVFVELAVARRELEAVVRQHRRAQAEVSRLTAEIERQNAELKATNRSFEAFSYSVSHDLRAPLRHLNGFAEILEQSLGPKLEPEKRRLLTILRESATHMDKLLEGLLDFSRSGRAVMNPCTVSLDQLIKSTLERLKPELAGRSIEWRIEALPNVEADATLLGQVLFNLFSNAIKFTRPRAQACIAVTSSRTDHELIVAVADNGVGFDMNFAAKLFGVFQRMHHPKEFEGTGIGLANVRRIIERHGGRTWAEAVPEQGATFYFSLPLPSQATAEIPAGGPNPEGNVSEASSQSPRVGPGPFPQAKAEAGESRSATPETEPSSKPQMP